MINAAMEEPHYLHLCAGMMDVLASKPNPIDPIVQ